MLSKNQRVNSFINILFYFIFQIRKWGDEKEHDDHHRHRHKDDHHHHKHHHENHKDEHGHDGERKSSFILPT